MSYIVPNEIEDERVADLVKQLIDWQQEIDENDEDGTRHAMIDTFLDMVLDTMM